jgi:tripartite-type tricarboxylate transporter receptor subunit TctC
MPRAITDKSDVRERLAQLAAEPGGTGPDEFGAYIKDQLGKMGKLAREVGLKPQ